MNIYGNYKSLLGYQSGENYIDSYGVDHSGFSTRDEIEYQSVINPEKIILIVMALTIVGFQPVTR